jgi:hypothetical protein
VFSVADFDLCGLNHKQMDAFITSKAFVFPQMLPDYCFGPALIDAPSRGLFMESEDTSAFSLFY